MGQVLYLTGGRQKSRSLDEWHAYERAVILRVAPDQSEVTCPVEYVSPPEVCPDADPSFIFKAPSLHGDRLFVPTNTEILIYEVPALRRAGYLSLPCFNDVHHVCVSPAGNLLVVSTGLDIVMEMTQDGRILREWSALGGNTWERFSRETDYRKVETTKPHASHPNHVWHDGEEIWVSRFKQRDAICLTRPGRRIEFWRGSSRRHRQPRLDLFHDDRWLRLHCRSPEADG
jgi:hypothetical protein